METGGNVPGAEDAADSHADALRLKRTYTKGELKGRRKKMLVMEKVREGV